MYRLLLKSKKGFTVVELVLVILLLSFGVVALANLFKAGYRAFQKSEERYIKQEAVKTVADLLRTGSVGVSAAQTADIFDTTEVVPTGSAIDNSYSYLYALKHENEETGEVDGYYLCVQDKGKNSNSARKLSNVPIYATIKAYQDTNKKGELETYSGVTVTLAALEDDFVYESTSSGGETVLNVPTSDDMYYTLDVAYHFPNMATKDTGITVNHIAKDLLSTANKYDESGNMLTGAGSVVEASLEGVVLRVYCDSIIGSDATEAEPSVPSMCFIATASYGLDTGEVGLLCDFRDKCLLTNPLGSAFVDAYYKLSPPVADFINESEPLKAVVRVALKPLVLVATYAVDSEITNQGIMYFAIFMLCGAGASATLLRISKRKNKTRN